MGKGEQEGILVVEPLPAGPFSPSSCIKTEPHVLPHGSTQGGQVADGGHAARRWGGILSTACSRFSYQSPSWFQPLTAGNTSCSLGSTGLTTCTSPQSSPGKGTDGMPSRGQDPQGTHRACKRRMGSCRVVTNTSVYSVNWGGGWGCVAAAFSVFHPFLPVLRGCSK